MLGGPAAAGDSVPGLHEQRNQGAAQAAGGAGQDDEFGHGGWVVRSWEFSFPSFSFPSSAWERRPAKLRLARRLCPGDLDGAPRAFKLPSGAWRTPVTKQSFVTRTWV